MDVKTVDELKKLAFKKTSKLLVVRVIFISIIMIANLLLPVVFSEVIDLITVEKYNTAIIMILIGLIVVAIHRILGYAKNHLWHVAYTKMYDIYSEVLFKKTMNNSLYSLSRFTVGEYVNLMHNDINIICTNTCNITFKVVSFVSKIVVLIYFFTIDIYIGILGILALILLFIIMFISQRVIGKVNIIKAKKYDDKNNLIDEFLVNIKEIKSNNLFKLSYDRTNHSTKKYVSSFLKQRVIEDLFKSIMLFSIEIFRWGLMFFGVYLISKGQMTIGTILIIYNYYTQLISGCTELTYLSKENRQRKVSLDRIDKLFEYSKDINYTDEHSDFKINGDICFENIIYGYKEDPMLNKFTFDFKTNSIHGIVGKAGSGKSAIYHLLLKLNRQHEGLVTIDEQDINEFLVTDYLKMVYVVRDESNYLNVSIRNIIKDAEVKFNKVAEYCKLFNIHEKITKLTDGYDSVLNVQNNNLTQKEKVLLSFAIGFSSKAKIFLIDNALDNLDYKTKMLIMSIFEDIKSDKNILIISNSADVLEKTDDIILLDKGKIKLTDQHDNLITNKEYTSIINI